MKTTLFQTDIVWGNPDENILRIEKLIDENPSSDLYVLPEMFSTGFATEPEGIAENDQQSLKWMRKTAMKHQCAIAGSVATEEDGKYYNRFYFVKPDGSEVHYDKHHLFTYGGEHKRFTAGKERVIVEYKGVRILLQVCYDLRFPIFARNHGDYDMALYVASWPTVRLDAWDILLHARAVENQCYVMGVDRTGDDPACSYSGGTKAIDPWGKTISECKASQVDAITIDINMQTLEDFRKKFPVLNDGDF